jgi:hypothetical protein
MEAHLLAPLLDDRKPPVPFLALLVSGGHTQLVLVQGLGRYELLGESVDDAAGEAFDKAAKMLGLGYPGGPALARCAEHGDPHRFTFPRPMTDRPGLDFSFSGLKTFTLNTVAAHRPLDDQDPRRHRPRLRGGRGRHAGDQVPAGGGADRRAPPGGGRRGERQPAAARAAGRATSMPRSTTRRCGCAPTTAR